MTAPPVPRSRPPAWLPVRSRPGGRRGAVPPALALLVALGSGVLLFAAFPPLGVWPAAPVALALLVLVLRGAPPRRGAALGLLHGLGFFVPLLHWSGIYVGAAPWLLLAVSQAAFLAALGALAPGLLVRRAGPVWFAALWVVQEAARARLPFGGFPWGRLAFGVDGSPLLRLAPLAGAPGVSFVLALTGALLAAAWRAGRSRRPPAATGLLAAALGLVLAGLVVPLGALSRDGGRTAVVALVQGNVPQLGLDFNAQREAVLRNHVQATHALASKVRAGQLPRPDLVVWPENSSDVDPFANPDAAALISGAVDDVGVPVVVGAVVDRPDGRLDNTSVVWNPGTGPGQRYVKRHPAPFAEYVPFRPLARLVSDKVDRVTDFAPGHLPPKLIVGGVPVADVICFEVAYDGLVRDGVRDGGQLIAVQTNNATFGRSAESPQQLAMTRFRAVEQGRTAVQVSTSGQSAVITPSGRIVAETGIFRPGLLVERVPLRTGLTPAARVGAWPELAAALAVAGALLPRRRRSEMSRRGGLPR